MANRRMFSKEVVETDLFLQLPLSAQALYFHIGMRADDDGFIDPPTVTLRACGARSKDLQALIQGGFIYQYSDGVCLVIDWRLNNELKGDRTTASKYRDDHAFGIKDSKRYDPQE